MSFLVERFAVLRRQLDHLHELRPRVTGPEVLARDLSLHNDVLFSLLSVCQTVIDIAGELSARRGERFDDDTQAIRNLASDPRFPPEVVTRLERIPGFRNILVHEYVALDLARVVDAVDDLEPIERFAAIVAGIEAGSEEPGP